MSVRNRTTTTAGPLTRRNRTFRARWVLLAAASATALATAACSSSGTNSHSGNGGSGGSKGSYNVQIVSDLTGASAGASSQISDGVMTAFDLQNSKGGVNGRKISYDTGDTQSTSTGSQAANRKAISNRPIAVMEATGSLAFDAAFPQLNSSKIPVIAANEYGYPLYPRLWGAVMTNAQLQTAMYNGVVSAAGGSLSGKKVAFVLIDTPANHSQADVEKSKVKAAGGTVTTVQFVAPGTASFSSGASKIVSGGTQALVISDAIPSVILEAKALKTAGYNGPIVINYNASDDKTLGEINGSNILGLRPYEYPDQSSQLYKWAVQFKHSTNAQTEGFSRGFLMGQMLIAGLGKCSKTCTSSTLPAAMDSVGTFTVPGDIMKFGPVAISKTVHNPLTVIGVFKYDAAKKAASHQATVKVGPVAYPATK